MDRIKRRKYYYCLLYTSLLEDMPPFLSGGEMIDSVSRFDAVYAPLPHKFEAGTVNGGGAVALQAAIEYMEGIGWREINKQEELLTEMAMGEMKRIPGVHLIGSTDPKKHHGIDVYKRQVYDDMVCSKMELALFSVRWIQEFLMVRWLEHGKTLSMQDVEEISWRYAREVEHSDDNLNALEDWLFEHYAPEGCVTNTFVQV